MPRQKLNALPQDSVLRALLRRQADWPDDAIRLVRSNPSRRNARDLNDAVDRIGRANRLRAEAEVLRVSAERAGYAMQPEVSEEIERLEREASALTGPVSTPSAAPTGKAAVASRPSRPRRQGRTRSRRP